jgi:hypothetical protein
VKIGDKLIDPDYSTSIYNYQDFAKTSYIQSISSLEIENNSNNLTDALRFNFTLEIKSADTYTIEAALYDEDDNYITTLNKSESLSTGTQNVIIDVDGKDIYSTYYNGELVLSYAKLSSKDIIYEAHTTDTIYYSDFERPDLPDLELDINVDYNSGTSNVTIKLTNKGTAPAFNILADIFDNSTFENQSALSYLDIGESQIYNYIITGTTNDTIVTAIADFDNYVDESINSSIINESFDNLSVDEPVIDNESINVSIEIDEPIIEISN